MYAKYTRNKKKRYTMSEVCPMKTSTKRILRIGQKKSKNEEWYYKYIRKNNN